MTRTEKRLLKLCDERQRLIKRIEKAEQAHAAAGELRGRLIRVTAEEIRTLVRIEKRKSAA